MECSNLLVFVLIKNNMLHTFITINLAVNIIACIVNFRQIAEEGN